MPKASLVICTYQRPDALARCLQSLDAQTEQDVERIILSHEGPLAAIRNEGLWRATAPVVCFIEDDTILPPTWLAGVLRTFDQHPEAVCVTGPAVVPPTHRAHRGLFAHPRLRRAYEILFGAGNTPGRVYPSGAVSYCDTPTAYVGPVDFPEACNMSWRTEALQAIGGFDEAYTALGEWCEPDAAFRARDHARLRRRDVVVWFTPDAQLAHCPAGGHATLRRRATRTRLANYRLFKRRWVRPSVRAWLHDLALRGYFGAVELGWR